MPANLTPEYKEAEEKYRSAKTPEEKMEFLELMLATIPKHKGTDKMQADIKRRIAKLKKSEAKKGGKKGISYHVDKQGAAQIAMFGPPNAGKTKFVNKVTNAEFTVGDYPYTTRIMQPAMMPYENIQFQLVDTPAIHPDYYERWVFGIIRHADLCLLVTDLSNPDLLDNIDNVVNILEEGKIFLTMDFPEIEEDYGKAYKKTMMLANKLDHPKAEEHLEILKEFYADRFRIFPVSSTTGEGIDQFAKALFDNLDIVRVFTRTRDKEPDRNNPFILEKGKTVEDLAYSIHKDIGRNMKFARIWGEDYYDGQPVDQHHELKDGDVIEIHT